MYQNEPQLICNNSTLLKYTYGIPPNAHIVRTHACKVMPHIIYQNITISALKGLIVKVHTLKTLPSDMLYYTFGKNFLFIK